MTQVVRWTIDSVYDYLKYLKKVCRDEVPAGYGFGKNLELNAQRSAALTTTADYYLHNHDINGVRQPFLVISLIIALFQRILTYYSHACLLNIVRKAFYMGLEAIVKKLQALAARYPALVEEHAYSVWRQGVPMTSFLYGIIAVGSYIYHISRTNYIAPHRPGMLSGSGKPVSRRTTSGVWNRNHVFNPSGLILHRLTTNRMSRDCCSFSGPSK